MSDKHIAFHKKLPTYIVKFDGRKSINYNKILLYNNITLALNEIER